MVFAMAGTSFSSAQNFVPLEVPDPLGEIVRNLDVNERGPDGSTPLQWAVYDQDVEKIRELIRAGADVNAANNFGANAMQLAAEVAHREILDLLLDAGADVDSPNPEGQTALMLVARTGDVAAAKLLVKNGATIDARESWGQQTALMWASARRHPAMMDLLIREGADINAISAVRDYNSHVTAEGRAKRLDSGGLTPLMFTVRENCKSCVELLIENNVDLDLTDPDGVSPLLMAILNANWDIARELIEAGADVQQWDKFGQAPLFAVTGNRNDAGLKVDGILNETDGLTIARMLLDAGANPNMQLFYRPAKARGGPLSRGTTPLIRAASGGDVELIKLLLEYGARADLPQADQISQMALAGKSASCEKTLHLFCAMLGSFCGSLALTTAAFGGVYIGGGIVPRFIDFLNNSEFRDRFEAKGRYRSYNEKIPTFVITAEYPGLLGAAAFLKRTK